MPEFQNEFIYTAPKRINKGLTDQLNEEKNLKSHAAN
jgi:hypothetical protein